ncbi:hypothetical protein CSUB01_05740 [Colletotrichum sublineola]|uniref:Uncharacterized protein n=1 Tax=Colletotrichum sublineola TaxID=1173701 RepID=A0A066X7I2_COLSU|nr:hypothetical protein CSUB01_05740 [Colletotrichum sublineola]
MPRLEDHEDRPSYVVVHRPFHFQSMWAFHGKAHPAMRTQRSRTSISEALLGKNSLSQELQTGYRACGERIWKLSGFLDSISRGEGTSSVPDLYQWRNAWAQRNYQVLRNVSSTELFRAGALEELRRVFLRRSPMGISYRHGTGSTEQHQSPHYLSSPRVRFICGHASGDFRRRAQRLQGGRRWSRDESGGMFRWLTATFGPSLVVWRVCWQRADG